MAKLGEKLADSTFVQMDGKRDRDAITLVPSAEPHDITT